jgi:hypothetical protein
MPFIGRVVVVVEVMGGVIAALEPHFRPQKNGKFFSHLSGVQ